MTCTLAGRQHRILEEPTVEALARARPDTEQQLNSLTKIPRFSKNKRRMYGRDIITALQQVQVLPVQPCTCETRRLHP